MTRWFTAALLWAWLPLAAAGEPERTRTPLCREVRGAVKADTPKREIIARIEGADVTADDVACLQRGSLPGYVLRKAQARLVKAHGIGALPTGPVDLWAVIPDPREIAAGQVTSLGVMYGDAMALLGVSDSVEQQTVDALLSQARSSFAEAGVSAEIQLERRALPELVGVVWEGGVQRSARVPAGEHYVLSVHIPDAVAAARASQGDAAVGIGARLGVDVQAMVLETVREAVWSKLMGNGVPSVLVELDGP